MCGSIPQALTYQPQLTELDLQFNNLSGTLSTIESPLRWLLIRANKLTGSIPAARVLASLMLLVCSGNMLEGTLPSMVMTSKLEYMDMSGTAGQIQGLRGQLPRKVGHALNLHHFMVSHQNLEGVIPPLRATLSTLALHSNHFSLLQGALWRNDGLAVVLMHIVNGPLSLQALWGSGNL